MAKGERKSQETRQVSFRTRVDVYEDYLAVAESRGVDLSALLNWVVVDYRPMLLLRYAQNEAGMLRAEVTGLPPRLSAGSDLQDSLDRVKELIGQLQDVATKLSAWVGGGAAKPAA